MQRLVEGCECVLKTGDLCDGKLGKNKVPDDEPEQDNPAHRRRTISECNSRKAFCTHSMPAEERTHNHAAGNQKRHSTDLRIACDKLHLSRYGMCLIVVLIGIFMLMSIGSLVLAILTSLKVNKLEDSSLLATCPKGHEEPIDCKSIQEIKKSLKGALRELGKLAHLKNSTITNKENQTIVSDDTQVLNGPSVAPEPSCPCTLSLCSYKKKQSAGISSGAEAQAPVSATEQKDMKFVGVYCGTNDAKVVTLSSTIDADGKRTYECKCKGTVKTKSVSLYCYIHYWECPI